MTRAVGVYMLDVGQGDATVVVPPEGEGGVVVFDCRDDVVVTKLLTFWRRTHIDAVVVSHLDWDHIAGVRQLLETKGITIGCVYVSWDRDITDEHPRAKEAKALIDCAKQGQRDEQWELLITQRDRRPIAAGDGWAVDLLAPQAALYIDRARTGEWEDPNRMSAILRVSTSKHQVLIGADAPLATWAGLPATELPSQVFRIPHHGGALDDGGIPTGWDVDRLYETVGASVAVVSVGTRNSDDHPNPRWIAPIAGGACRLMCTQVTPRCHPKLREDAEVHRKTVLGRKYLVEPYWRHADDRLKEERREPEVPCAGIVLVKLEVDGDVTVLPTSQGHARTVSLWKRPLCRPTP